MTSLPGFDAGSALRLAGYGNGTTASDLQVDTIHAAQAGTTGQANVKALVERSQRPYYVIPDLHCPQGLRPTLVTECVGAMLPVLDCEWIDQGDYQCWVKEWRCTAWQEVWRCQIPALRAVS